MSNRTKPGEAKIAVADEKTVDELRPEVAQATDELRIPETHVDPDEGLPIEADRSNPDTEPTESPVTNAQVRASPECFHPDDVARVEAGND